MPSRLLREGILDSEAVNALSVQAELFYRRLMSVVDDFGRFDGRPSVLRGRLYALKLDTVREADISRWSAECAKAGLIVLYTVDDKPYILFSKLGTPRAKESKFPPPPDSSEVQHQITSANECAQPFTDVPYSYSGSGSGSDSGSDSIYCTEPATPATVPDEPAVMTFPTVGTGPKEWHLTAAKLTEWRSAFPGVDALAECRKALQWLLDNPAKRKTANGMTKFLGGWLGRAQDRAPVASNRSQMSLFDNAGKAEARAVGQVMDRLSRIQTEGN